MRCSTHENCSVSSTFKIKPDNQLFWAFCLCFHCLMGTFENEMSETINKISRDQPRENTNCNFSDTTINFLLKCILINSPFYLSGLDLAFPCHNQQNNPISRIFMTKITEHSAALQNARNNIPVVDILWPRQVILVW